jgi:hypothetical protein
MRHKVVVGIYRYMQLSFVVVEIIARFVDEDEGRKMRCLNHKRSEIDKETEGSHRRGSE